MVSCSKFLQDKHRSILKTLGGICVTVWVLTWVSCVPQDRVIPLSKFDWVANTNLKVSSKISHGTTSHYISHTHKHTLDWNWSRLALLFRLFFRLIFRLPCSSLSCASLLHKVWTSGPDAGFMPQLNGWGGVKIFYGRSWQLNSQQIWQWVRFQRWPPVALQFLHEVEAGSVRMRSTSWRKSGHGCLRILWTLGQDIYSTPLFGSR